MTNSQGKPSGKVLIVEDYEAVLHLMERRLQKDGHTIITAQNGVEAIAKMYEFVPDVIIADIKMPDMDGFELCRKIRAESFWKDIPFIFISAKDDLDTKLAAFDVGGDDYLTKPFQLEELAARIRVNMERVNKVRYESETDFLTGALNRRAMDKRLEVETRRSARYGHMFSVAMVDLDHFKKFNDKMGHQAGDVALRHVADRLIKSLRDMDVVARFGGEEFVVILPETKKDGAALAIERIREKLSQDPISLNGKGEASVTMSAGVAGFPDDGKTTVEIINAADTALYNAKANGRNRVVISQ
ncbi:MAG: diguanylate cyclase [Nitrospinae bacterium]|nr:diguanylate cyclase [Nitrospinota bacterium]